jgi:hypothetical protein
MMSFMIPLLQASARQSTVWKTNGNGNKSNVRPFEKMLIFQDYDEDGNGEDVRPPGQFGEPEAFAEA